MGPLDPRPAPRADGILAVMMPVYNEERTLETILSHVLACPEVGELIVVDDGSADRSWEIIGHAASRDPRVRAFRQDRNRGKGAALRRAVEEVSLPYAIVQDADLEYDPEDYAALLEPVLQGRADAVFGVRGFAGQTAYSFWFVLGNRFVTFACNVLFNCWISDLETGYKLLRTDLWRRLHLSGERFDIEPQIAARVLRLGYRIHEIPIRYYARSREEGKKLTWMDGIRALGTLLGLRLASDRQLFGGPDDYHRERQRELAQQHPLLTRQAGPNGTGSHRRA